MYSVLPLCTGYCRINKAPQTLTYTVHCDAKHSHSNKEHLDETRVSIKNHVRFQGGLYMYMTMFMYMYASHADAQPS